MKDAVPAAICRKVVLARDGDEIEIWGDGKQTRSYMYEVVDIVAGVAGKRLRKRWDLSRPQG